MSQLKLSLTKFQTAIKKLAIVVLKAGRYNPDQPRDNSGRWTSGGGSEAGGAATGFVNDLRGEGYVPRRSYDVPGDWDFGTPDGSIKSGVTDGAYPSEFSVFYRGGNTIVSASGEAENTEPWQYKGRLTPEQVLQDYIHDNWINAHRDSAESMREYNWNLPDNKLPGGLRRHSRTRQQAYEGPMEPDKPGRLRSMINRVRGLIGKAGYKSDQARDERGRWSGVGGKDFIGPPRYAGYETAGHPEYAAARAAGYPHSRRVFENEQQEHERRSKQPMKPEASGKYKLSVVEEGGGAGTYIAHYDGSGFEDEDAAGVEVSPAKATAILSSLPSEHHGSYTEYVLSRGDEAYTWNNRTKSWHRDYPERDEG